MGLRYAPHVQDAIRTLAPEPKRALRAPLRLIAEDPLHPAIDKKLLRKDGPFRFWRARVLNDYRIVYSPRADHTYIWAVIHRDEGHDWLDRLDPLVQRDMPVNPPGGRAEPGEPMAEREIAAGPCHGIEDDGSPCMSPAMPGSVVCERHGP